MKKLLNILLTSVLAIALVVMASGVTFHHCSCSGKTTMLLGHLTDTESAKASNTSSSTSATKDCEANSDRCMPVPKGCMTISSVSLSPTTPIHPVSFDFQVFQPLVAIINDWHFFNLIPQQVESTRSFLPTNFFSPPPRQYLHILRVLTIWFFENLSISIMHREESYIPTLKRRRCNLF